MKTEIVEILTEERVNGDTVVQYCRKTDPVGPNNIISVPPVTPQNREAVQDWLAEATAVADILSQPHLPSTDEVKDVPLLGVPVLNIGGQDKIAEVQNAGDGLGPLLGVPVLKIGPQQTANKSKTVRNDESDDSLPPLLGVPGQK